MMPPVGRAVALQCLPLLLQRLVYSAGDGPQSAARSTAPTVSLAVTPCSDWAQCFVLELVTHYQPASEEERFDILEASC